MMNRFLKVAGVVLGHLVALFNLLRETLASPEIQEEHNDQPMQDTGLIGEYNFRTHRLDAGTDPDGWYEEDM